MATVTTPTKEGGGTINAPDTKSNFARTENFIRGGSSLIAGTLELIQLQKVIDSELFDKYTIVFQAIPTLTEG